MVDFNKGDTVTFAKGTEGISAGGWSQSKRFTKGSTAVVSRVFATRLTVRAPFNGQTLSFNVDRDALETPNGEKWTQPAKPKVRAIGQKPEGDHIDKDDPRIQWIFEDAARVAQNSYYCNEFDRLADRLGIPGRLRNIDVITTVNGLKISTTVKARSTKEAVQLVADKLGKSEKKLATTV